MLPAPKPGVFFSQVGTSGIVPGQTQGELHCKGGKLHFDGGWQAAASKQNEAMSSLYV